MLSLHEAIVIALININKETFTASFDEIADYIKNKDLYPERKEGVDLTTQLLLRNAKSKGNYIYLFTQVDESLIKINGKT